MACKNILAGHFVSISSRSKAAVTVPEIIGDVTTLASTLIYDNNITSSSWYHTSPAYELLDFGTSVGGSVNSFTIGYVTTLSDPGTVTIRFRAGTTSSRRGTCIKGFNISRKALSALYLTNKADETRTHNLRIDSPNLSVLAPAILIQKR